MLAVEFGEKLWYHKPKGAKLEKINARWEEGVFVGIIGRSSEVMVSTKQGIVEVRSVKRMAEIVIMKGRN